MLKDKLYKNRFMLWYTLCFFALGVIDQRRNTAEGSIQMTVANCVGIVLAAMVLPSLDRKKFKNKIYLIWSGLSLLGGIGAIVWGSRHWPYLNQWVAGVLNVVIWGYLVIYVLREWRSLSVVKRLRQPFFWCAMLLYLLMFFTAQGSLVHLWMLLIFGGFYLIGVAEERREDFIRGLLNGIVVWFFVLQTIAFGFRPYDIVRYRGLYRSPTQSGVFYMITYCAFLCKWLYAKEKCKRRLTTCLYFFLAAGCISFLLFTGSRSSLMGAAMSTLILFVLYDIVHKKSFYKWLLHLALLGLCVVISFPLVYGSIRYLPTILHHPVWFMGEYNEEKSVRSFDPWNSERYISFDKTFEYNMGRILKIMGIEIHEKTKEVQGHTLLLRVQAAEAIPRGSSPENPFAGQDFDRSDAVDVRSAIYKYYAGNLNLWGHSNSLFYLMEDKVITHPHNMLLHIAYNHGIIAGLLFLALNLYTIFSFAVKSFRKLSGKNWVLLAIYIAVFSFGMTELALMPGSITWVFIYLSFYFAGEDSRQIIKHG